MLIYSILVFMYNNISYVYDFKNTFFYLKTNNKREFFYLQIYFGYKMRRHLLSFYTFVRNCMK